MIRRTPTEIIEEGAADWGRWCEWAHSLNGRVSAVRLCPELWERFQHAFWASRALHRLPFEPGVPHLFNIRVKPRAL